MGSRLRLLEHVRMRSADYIGIRMLNMELPGKERKTLRTRVVGVAWADKRRWTRRMKMQCRGPARIETDDPLWRPLMRIAERRGSYCSFCVYQAIIKLSSPPLRVTTYISQQFHS